MKERFENRKLDGDIMVTLDKKVNKIWTADKAEIIDRIIHIVNDYQNQGYTLTLRQLYYQLVGRDWIPNHDKVYKRLSKILDDCRYSGIVDWNAIEDRGRIPYTPYIEVSIPDAIKRVENSYNLDKKLGQPIHVELWSEKDAISGILKRATYNYTTTVVINKGFASSTSIHDAYNRFVKKILNGQKICILYFGDHDPSGLDMIRDVEDRLIKMLIRGNNAGDIYNHFYDEWREGDDTEFPQEILDILDYGDLKYREFLNKDSNTQARLYAWTEVMVKYCFEVKAIGLTMEQINKYKLPHNPAKMSDSRAAKYVAKYGEKSWEVDALQPADLVSIIQEEMTKVVDFDLITKLKTREKEERSKLRLIAENVTAHTNNLPITAFASKDEWGEWDCPECNYRQSDPEEIRKTVCGECEVAVHLSDVVDGKRKVKLNKDE